MAHFPSVRFLPGFCVFLSLETLVGSQSSSAWVEHLTKSNLEKELTWPSSASISKQRESEDSHPPPLSSGETEAQRWSEV